MGHIDNSIMKINGGSASCMMFVPYKTYAQGLCCTEVTFWARRRIGAEERNCLCITVGKYYKRKTECMVGKTDAPGLQRCKARCPITCSGREWRQEERTQTGTPAVSATYIYKCTARSSDAMKHPKSVFSHVCCTCTPPRFCPFPPSTCVQQAVLARELSPPRMVDMTDWPFGCPKRWSDGVCGS